MIYFGDFSYFMYEVSLNNCCGIQSKIMIIVAHFHKDYHIGTFVTIYLFKLQKTLIDY